MQRILSFSIAYDNTERKCGILVLRKRTVKKEEYNYRASVACLDFFHCDFADSYETNLKEVVPKSKIDP